MIKKRNTNQLVSVIYLMHNYNFSSNLSIIEIYKTYNELINKIT